MTTLTGSNSKNRWWSEADDALLRAEYCRGQAARVAATLGRSLHAVVKRAERIGVAQPRPAIVAGRRKPDAPLPSPDVVVELAEARMEVDALRVLLALKCLLLSAEEAAAALGVSHERPLLNVNRGPGLRTASPLAMHLAEQAARGMDLASKRLGRGGVLGDTLGSNQHTRRVGSDAR